MTSATCLSYPKRILPYVLPSYIRMSSSSSFSSSSSSTFISVSKTRTLSLPSPHPCNDPNTYSSDSHSQLKPIRFASCLPHHCLNVFPFTSRAELQTPNPKHTTPQSRLPTPARTVSTPSHRHTPNLPHCISPNAFNYRSHNHLSGAAPQLPGFLPPPLPPLTPQPNSQPNLTSQPFPPASPIQVSHLSHHYLCILHPAKIAHLINTQVYQPTRILNVTLSTYLHLLHPSGERQA